MEGDLKYIWFSQDGREQLFDLGRDPKEQTDCAGDPAYAEALARLRGHLTATLGRRGDGYSDGEKLRTGVRPHALLPFLEKRAAVTR